ncbi:uncharacterized protein FOBCDRAFT_220175, partial [Fusarium oxysporum Fo47]|uniref:uncharacterized protein n=1 Tax=Fusarium oxysporum Fo47 TaxID=660027 RepID=UPI0028698522
MHDNGTFLRLLLYNKSTMMIRQAAVRNCESTVRRKRRLRVLARGSKATESIRDAGKFRQSMRPKHFGCD